MIKGKKLILTIAIGGVLLGSSLFGGAYYENMHTGRNSGYTASVLGEEFKTSCQNNAEISYAYNGYKNTLFANNNDNTVTLENKALETALKNILGVDTLKTDSISTHADFKERETTEGSGIYTANKTCLDLSNTGITDITELCLFDIPTTLKAINLAGNGITNEQLPKIIEFTTYKAEQSITYNEKTITSQSNFDLIISKINLCFNDINLNALETSTLNHTKLIFGIQKLYNIHSSRLVLKEELKDCYYYFKNDDFNYISPAFSRNSIIVGFIEGAITGITASEVYGKYAISVSGVNNSVAGYFNGWTTAEEFTVFTVKVADGYFAEKLSLFSLPEDKLVFDGISPTWKITGSPNTKKVGTFKLNVTITSGTQSRLVYVDYVVKDTIAPVIELVGQTHISIRDTSIPFHDPGVKGYDSNGAEDISGDVVSNAEEVLEIVNGKYVKKTYVITYTLKDSAGNQATPVTRTVTVQEGVLDAIVIKCQTDADKIQTGKDVILEVKPDDGIPVNKYKNFEYHWFVDGVKQTEVTYGDSVSGKSSKTFIFNTIGNKEISVVLYAKDLNGNKVEVYSEAFIVDVNASLRNNDTLILAAAITVGVILIVVVVVTIVKYRKAHTKSHVKTSAYHKKNKNSSAPNGIKVIKDYNGSNGGNSNFKPDKTQDKSSNNTNDKSNDKSNSK